MVNAVHISARQRFAVRSRIRLASVMLACFGCLLAGCISSSAVRNLNATNYRRFQGDDTVVVETVSQVPKADQERDVLHALVISGLQKSGKFKTVASRPPTDTSGSFLKITSRVTRLRKVSDVARGTLGNLAGQAVIVAEVEMSEAPQGNKLKLFEAVGKSANMGVMAGTTDDAIQAAASDIVWEISKDRSR